MLLVLRGGLLLGLLGLLILLGLLLKLLGLLLKLLRGGLRAILLLMLRGLLSVGLKNSSTKNRYLIDISSTKH